MYNLEIDNDPFSSADPVLTGRQLLTLAGKQPVEEYLVFYLGADRQLEDIDLEETVDLRAPGRETFITFSSDRTFNFELDGRRQPWGNDTISEKTLKWLAGVGDGYRVWQERRAQEDLLLNPGQIVSLELKGVERFYTGKEDTNAGERCLVLPESDQRFVDDHNMIVEAVVDGNRKGVVFKGFDTGSRFDRRVADPAKRISRRLPGHVLLLPVDQAAWFCWLAGESRQRSRFRWPAVAAMEPAQLGLARWR